MNELCPNDGHKIIVECRVRLQTAAVELSFYWRSGPGGASTSWPSSLSQSTCELELGPKGEPSPTVIGFRLPLKGWDGKPRKLPISPGEKKSLRLGGVQAFLEGDPF